MLPGVHITCPIHPLNTVAECFPQSGYDHVPSVLQTCQEPLCSQGPKLRFLALALRASQALLCSSMCGLCSLAQLGDSLSFQHSSASRPCAFARSAPCLQSLLCSGCARSHLFSLLRLRLPAPSSEAACAGQGAEPSHALLPRLFEPLLVCLHCLMVVSLFVYISFLGFKIHEDRDRVLISLCPSQHRCTKQGSC